MPLRWNLLDRDQDRSRDLSLRLGVSVPFARILCNRGLADVEAARAFLKPDLMHLGDPDGLAGMPAATERLFRSVEGRERIVIYGDYDVDGVSGSSILVHLLRRLEADVGYYVPHRRREGYGLNVGAVEKIAAEGARLLVTVDCGIRSVEEVARAQALGVDVIVTDHHLPGPELPPAHAVVNPRRPDCRYVFKDLCGACVAFKLAWSLARRITGARRVSPELREFLIEAMTFAAVGTIADVLPLVGENRVIAHYGLIRLAKPANPGLDALLDVSGVDRKNPLTARDVGFGIGPRINAAGRMGHASRALELFLAHDPGIAHEIARELDSANKDRKETDRRMFDEAVEQVESRGLDRERAIVLGSDSWHPGVIGIVAGRLAGRYFRPVVLVAFDGETGRGSARSIPAYHICDALDRVSEHLEAFGGHAGAAGLEIRADRMDRFAEALVADAAQRLAESDLVGVLDIDAECDIREIHRGLVAEIHRLAPFGEGNPSPVLSSRLVEVVGNPRRMGKKGEHSSFVVRQDQATLRAVAFGRGDLVETLQRGARVALAYELEVNRYAGTESVELHVKDLALEGGS